MIKAVLHKHKNNSKTNISYDDNWCTESNWCTIVCVETINDAVLDKWFLTIFQAMIVTSSVHFAEIMSLNYSTLSTCSKITLHSIRYFICQKSG